MKKRQTAMLLALLLIAVSVTGCGVAEQEKAEQNTEKPGETAGNTEETEAEWHAFDNLPDMDYGGRTFTILARTGNEAQFASEELTGELVNDSIYNRNLAVMGKYNIDIAVPAMEGDYGFGAGSKYIANIRASVQAGDGAYDLIDGYAAEVGWLVVDKCFYDLNEIRYIEPSEKWWSVSAVEDLSINGLVFLTPGDITMSLYDHIHALFFNQDVFTQFGLDDPYDMVLDGTWTYDALLELSSKCMVDTNGDGTYNTEDGFGTVFSDDLEFNNFHFAFQIPITVKDESGYPVFNLWEESVADLVEQMKTLAYETDGVYYTKGDGTAKINMFMAGQCAIMPNLLGTTTALRDMESDFGILPYPKMNEAQEGYYTSARDNVTLFGIPVDIADPDFTGHIAEALCQVSYEMVKPVYYENVLKTKLARDEESQQMIDILRDGLIFDIGYICSTQLERAGFLVRDCVYYNYDYASRYQAQRNVYDTALEEYLAAFK